MNRVEIMSYLKGTYRIPNVPNASTNWEGEIYGPQQTNYWIADTVSYALSGDNATPDHANVAYHIGQAAKSLEVQYDTPIHNYAQLAVHGSVPDLTDYSTESFRNSGGRSVSGGAILTRALQSMSAAGVTVDPALLAALEQAKAPGLFEQRSRESGQSTTISI